MANENQIIIGAGQDTARRAPKINTITCGDCLEVMQGIPDKCVDMVFADPPYNLNGLDSFIDLSTYRKWSRQWIEECFRTLKYNGTFIISGMQPVLSYLVVDIAESGKVFREFITWNKVDSITPTREYHSRNYEQFAIFSKWINRKFTYLPVASESKNYGNERNIGCIWNHCKISSNHNEGTKHPTQKPVKFLKRFIETYTEKGDTVLDPFMGSGTTAQSCIETGRDFIGCDISEEYCRMAEERIHALRSPAQDTMEICHTAPNSASPKAAQVTMELE
jgi:DNA modification methylase